MKRGCRIWAAVAIIGPLLACACPDSSIILTEFEDMCSNVPCGWTLEEGRVEQTPTFHPAIQGIRIEAGSVLAYERTPSAASFDVLARCEGNVGLIVAGQRVEYSTELYEWRTASSPRAELAIEVTGTMGHCIIDDIAYVPECQEE